jgi:hypothetical protein
MSALPEKGTPRIFKRAVIDFFCSDLEEGQAWSYYALAEDRDMLLIVREIQPSRVHYTINDHWYWLTLGEFVQRRLDGRIQKYAA